MAAETRKSRKSNFSQDEVDVLVTTVIQNHDILYGESSKSFFHKEIRNQVWNIVLEEVNKVSLERRTLNEVKNKWKKCQYNLKTAEVSEKNSDYVECDDLDSMPLQQRLSQNHNEPAPPTQPQETVLQSQPISPTKLKVTRQGKPQPPPPRAPTPPPPPPPQVCLKWNSHHINMQSAFPNLLTKEQYVDATLVSEGKTLKCHRMILSSCSPYFEEILNGIGPLQHPVLFMRDIPFWILKALCDFMYAGEVHLLQDKLQELLKVASTLKIKGLTGSPDTSEDVKPIVPEIKQEIGTTPPPKIPDKPLKEEKQDEPPPLLLKAVKHEIPKPSKKKEERKSKHANQALRDKIVEEPPPKVALKLAPKVVPKVVLPKIPPAPKTTVKNMKNVIKFVPKPSTSKTTHSSRKSDSSRRSEKHMAEIAVQKEKEKEKEKPLLKKDNINDPLDLLQPVYEEIAKDEPPQPVKSVSPAKLKERGNVPVKKGVNKKVKKRKYAEYAEEREESPPPLFHSRKGTRSRPNVKIPKFFHTHFDDSPKETTDATIVREPHTDQNDPLIGVELEEIKAEPLDVEENAIEMEDNLVNYMVQDQEMISQEGEEIIGNYDSPLVNIKREPKRNTPNMFKKGLHPQPIIMNVHTVMEPDLRLLEIKKEDVQIVDIAKISTVSREMIETIIGTNSFDVGGKPSEIIISSVQSMAELSEESHLRERDKGVLEEPLLHTLADAEVPPSLPASTVDELGVETTVETRPILGVKSLEVLTSHPSVFAGRQTDTIISERVAENLPPSEPDPLASTSLHTNELQLQCEEHPRTLHNSLDNEESAMETDEIPLDFRIENVTENSDLKIRKDNTGTEQCDSSLQAVESEDLNIQNHSNTEPPICSSSVGSVEAKIDINSESLALEDKAFNNPLDNTNIGLVTEEIPSEESSSQNETRIESQEAENKALEKETIGYSPQESEGSPSEAPEKEIDLHNQNQEQKQVNSSTLVSLEAKTVELCVLSEKSVLEEQNIVSEGTSDSLQLIQKSAQGSEEIPLKVIESDSEEPPDLLVETECPAEQLEATSAEDTEAQTICEEPTDLLVETECSADQLEATSTENTEAQTIVDQSAPVVNVSSPERLAETTELFGNEQNTLELTEVLSGLETNNEELKFEDQNSASNVEEQALGIICESEKLVSLDNQGENIIQNISDQVECTQTENAETREQQPEEKKLLSQDNELDDLNCEKSGDNVNAALESEIVDLGHNLPEAEKDSTENIEAELEQCLASTSNIIPVIFTEGRLKVRPLSFEEEEEDFTKDIEFDNFTVARNRPTNYLGDDFETDFEMVETDGPKNEENDTVEERSDYLDSTVEIGAEDDLDKDIDMEDACNLKKGDSLETEGINKTGSEDVDNKIIENEAASIQGDEECSQMTLNTFEIFKQKDAVCNKCEKMEQNNVDEKISLENNRDDDLTREIEDPESPSEHHTSPEEEERMEEKLLADLDDDVEVKNATTSQEEEEEDDGTEKTLEMIVNDLNESLGEMKK